MHKATLLAALCIFCLQSVMADSPDKRPMFESKISFQNIKQFKGYTFYYHLHSEDVSGKVVADTSLIVPPSSGGPDHLVFWGVNNKTKKSTDTIQFDNYYAPDYVVVLTEIRNDSLKYTQTGLTNKNAFVNTGNTENISNKEIVKEAATSKRSHYNKIAAYVAAALLALGLLVWFFIKQKRKSSEV